MIYTSFFIFIGTELPPADSKSSKSGDPSSMLKYLSVKFRRKLVIVHAPPTQRTGVMRAEYNLMQLSDLPALYIKWPADENGKHRRLKYPKDDFSRRAIEKWLKPHALKEDVYEKWELDGNRPREAESEL